MKNLSEVWILRAAEPPDVAISRSWEQQRCNDMIIETFPVGLLQCNCTILGDEQTRGAIDQFVQDGDAVACHGVEMGVIHTPGHTPGSTTFHLARDRNILFTGDTLFMQSIGRTDLWGGSYQEIIRSIEKKLMTFGDDTLVIAGHGQSTTIGHERRYKPFLK